MPTSSDASLATFIQSDTSARPFHPLKEPAFVHEYMHKTTTTFILYFQKQTYGQQSTPTLLLAAVAVGPAGDEQQQYAYISNWRAAVVSLAPVSNTLSAPCSRYPM